MKLKYRKFDDTEYTEIECYDFMYNFYKPCDLVLLVFSNDGKSEDIENVCEVYIEEI